MSGPVFSAAERAWAETALLTRLRAEGPCTARALAEGLGRTVRQAGWLCGQLRARGWVRATRTTPKWWAVAADAPAAEEPAGYWKRPRPRQPKRPADVPVPGITAEDRAWMAYWRQPRAVRRAQEARRDAG